MSTPAPEKRLIRRAFERAAGRYDQAAVLQREVADRMNERLDAMRITPRRVLDAGSGTGYGTERLRERFPHAAMIALDLAHAMLVRLRARDAWWKRWLGRSTPAVCGDIERLPLASGSVDLVCSNLTLQWCATPTRAFAEFRRVLAPGGLLIFSTFGPDTLKELRAAFAAADGYRHVNRFVDMHDLGDALIHAGFEAPVMEMEMLTLTYGEVRKLLEDLKAIGAHTVLEGRLPGLMGKRRFAAMVAAYETMRRDGRLPATFEVIYGHAWVGRTPEIARGIPLRVLAR